jgi:ribosomal RNA-processing protein 9
MAGIVRKRARDAAHAAETPSARDSARRRTMNAKGRPVPAGYARKRAAMEADEVDSDVDSEEDVPGQEAEDGDGVRRRRKGGDSDEDADGGGDGDVDLPDETVEQKRLRLARAYLSNVGLDPDAAGSDGDEGDEGRGGDGDGDGGDGAIARLQDDARRSSGRTVTELAAYIGERCGAEALSVARSVRAHDVAATCVSVSTDETRAVSGGKDSRVVGWDVETGAKVVDLRPKAYEARWRKEPARAPGHVGHVLSVAVADGQGGNILASGGTDELVRIWDVRAGRQVEALRGHRGAVNALVFRQGTMQLFSGSADRTVKIWNVDDMAYVETLFGHGAEVCGVDSFSKERAVSCGRDGTMRLYKVLDGSQLVFRRALTTSLDTVAMINEQRFVSGGDDGAVALWHVNKKRPVSVAAHAHGAGVGADAWIASVAAGRNTDLAASGAGDGVVRLWHCADRPPALNAVAAVDVGRGFVNGLAFGGRSRVLIAALGQEPRLGRWERQRAKSGLRFIVLPQRE